MFDKGGGGGGGGFRGLKFERGVAGKEWVTFFKGGCSFFTKNKLRSEIFNDNKLCKQKCFSLS